MLVLFYLWPNPTCRFATTFTKVLVITKNAASGGPTTSVLEPAKLQFRIYRRNPLKLMSMFSQITTASTSFPLCVSEVR